jgi:hypothetical protein
MLSWQRSHEIDASIDSSRDLLGVGLRHRFAWK